MPDESSIEEPQEARVAALTRAYADHAANHGLGNERSDPQLTNVSADRLAQVHRQLLKLGESGRAAILSLLAAENASVRSWAATHALEFAPDRAVPVLEALAAGKGWPIAFNARMTLQAWRKGELKFP